MLLQSQQLQGHPSKLLPVFTAAALLRHWFSETFSCFHRSLMQEHVGKLLLTRPACTSDACTYAPCGVKVVLLSLTSAVRTRPAAPGWASSNVRKRHTTPLATTALRFMKASSQKDENVILRPGSCCRLLLKRPRSNVHKRSAYSSEFVLCQQDLFAMQLNDGFTG